MSISNGKHNYPKISIVTPSFNQGQYLEKTILSVLDQNYPNLEYIIIDGGSTDNSVDIIKKYEKHLKCWVSEPDRGQSHAINKGFEHATGDLMAWLNSDDYYMPGALHKVAEVAMAKPEAGAIIGAGQFVNESGKVKLYKEPAEVTLESLYDWLDIFHFMQSSCFFRKNVWDKCGPLDEQIHIAMDLNLWLRIAKQFEFVRTGALLSSQLLHLKAKTMAFHYLTIVDSAIVIMRHGGEQQIREHLEDIARKLSYYEPNLNLIIRNPIFKLVEPIVKLFMKSATRWRDIMPSWSNSRKR